VTVVGEYKNTLKFITNNNRETVAAFKAGGGGQSETIIGFMIFVLASEV